MTEFGYVNFISFLTKSNCFLAITNNGEPSFVHTVEYVFADRLGLICKITPLKIEPPKITHPNIY